MTRMSAKYTVRMRAYAAAHFAFDDVLTVSWPDADAKLQSEYTLQAPARSFVEEGFADRAKSRVVS